MTCPACHASPSYTSQALRCIWLARPSQPPNQPSHCTTAAAPTRKLPDRTVPMRCSDDAPIGWSGPIHEGDCEESWTFDDPRPMECVSMMIKVYPLMIDITPFQVSQLVTMMSFEFLNAMKDLIFPRWQVRFVLHSPFELYEISPYSWSDELPSLLVSDLSASVRPILLSCFSIKFCCHSVLISFSESRFLSSITHSQPRHE